MYIYIYIYIYHLGWHPSCCGSCCDIPASTKGAQENTHNDPEKNTRTQSRRLNLAIVGSEQAVWRRKYGEEICYKGSKSPKFWKLTTNKSDMSQTYSAWKPIERQHTNKTVAIRNGQNSRDGKTTNEKSEFGTWAKSMETQPAVQKKTIGSSSHSQRKTPTIPPAHKAQARCNLPVWTVTDPSLNVSARSSCTSYHRSDKVGPWAEIPRFCSSAFCSAIG